MKRNKKLVIGAGRLGSSIAVTMSEQGEDVVVVDKMSDSFRKLDDSFGGYTIEGDATDQSFLENLVMIKEVDEAIITTDSDNVNFFLASLCFYKYEVPYIYVRFSDPQKGELLEDTNIVSIYPYHLTKQAFLKHREWVRR